MIPGRGLVLIALVPLGLAMMALADRSLLWTMLGVDACILLIAGVDAALAWRPLVSVSRSAREVFSIGQPNLVTLTLRSRAARRLKVLVKDDLFEEAGAEELPLLCTLPARGRATARYHVRPGRRGAYELGDHHVRYRSPLGLWVRQVRIAASQPVKVFPDVRAVRTFELLALSNRESSMFRSTRRLGGETEFERLREYRSGDEYRSIDWRATARRGELIARSYQLETSQSILFLLDAGRLMTAQTAGLSLFDHALNATLMLSHIAARNGDHVGMLAFADEIKSFAPPAAGHRATQRIIMAGYHLHADLVESSFRAAFEHLGARVRQRTLMVIFTQVVDEVAAAELLRLTRGLLPRHLPLLVLFRDPEVEALLEGPRTTGLGGGGGAERSEVEAYTRAAAAEVTHWRDRLIHDLKARGALILDVLPTGFTPDLINRYLEIKARHLL